MSSNDDPFLEEPPGGSRPSSHASHRFNPMGSGERPVRSRSVSISKPHTRGADAPSGTPHNSVEVPTGQAAQGRPTPTIDEIFTWPVDQVALFVHEHVHKDDMSHISNEGSVALYDVLERTYKLEFYDILSCAFSIVVGTSHSWLSLQEVSRLMRAASIRASQSSRSHATPVDWTTATPRAPRHMATEQPPSPTSHLHTGHIGDHPMMPEHRNEQQSPGKGKQKETLSGKDNTIPPLIQATIDLIASSIRSLLIKLDDLPEGAAQAARDSLHLSFAPKAPSGSFTFHNEPTAPPTQGGSEPSSSTRNKGHPLPQRPSFPQNMPRHPTPPRNRGPPPPVNCATRPSTSAPKSYTSVAKADLSDILVHAGRILASAPSITPEEALAIAKTIPIAPKPSTNKGRKAVIQGTKGSLAIATGTTLLSERAVPTIVAEVATHPLLSGLPKMEVTVSMNRLSAILNGGVTLSDEQKTAFIDCVARATNAAPMTVSNNQRATHSVLKLDFLPTQTIIGPTTVEMVVAALNANPVFRAQQLFEPITLVPNRCNPAFTTACIKVLDDRAGHAASTLLKQSVLVCSEHREILRWESKPTARQCTQCQCWGHNHHLCKSRGAFCMICGEPHTTSSHVIYCSKCKEAGDDPINCIEHEHCINCSGAHAATSHECPWFKARSNPTEMKALQERKRTTNASARATRSATRRGPPPSLSRRAPAQQNAQASSSSAQQPPEDPPFEEEEEIIKEAMNEDEVTAGNA